jgi:hypothetical protein
MEEKKVLSPGVHSFFIFNRYMRTNIYIYIYIQLTIEFWFHAVEVLLVFLIE